MPHYCLRNHSPLAKNLDDVNSKHIEESGYVNLIVFRHPGELKETAISFKYGKCKKEMWILPSMFWP